MKIFYKISCIALIFIFAISIFTNVAICADAEPAMVITVSDSSPKAGDEITVTIGIENNPGIWSLAFELPIDNNIFEFVKADTSQSILKRFAICDYDQNSFSYKFNAFNTDLFNNMNNDGVLAIITLKVKDDVKAGTHYLSCVPDDNNIINVDEQHVKFNACSYSINVGGSESDPQSSIIAADIVLGEKIVVNYYAKLDAAHISAQMKFTVNGKETIVDGTPSPTYEGEYVYSLSNIDYSDFDSNIKAELIMDQQILDLKEEYSIKTYCDRMQNKSSDQIGISQELHTSLKKLLSALLSYGECLNSSSNVDEIKESESNYKVALNGYAEK